MSTRRSGSSRKKKGPTKGSGGQGRRKLAGRGPTPKASERTWHKNYRPPAPKKKRSALRRPLLVATRLLRPLKQKSPLAPYTCQVEWKWTIGFESPCV